MKRLIKNTRNWIQGSRRFAVERIRARTAVPYSNPLLIFGNQKSGTTAIAALLAYATEFDVTNDFLGARQPYLGRVVRSELSVRSFIYQNAWAFSRPIIKEPGLTFIACPLMDELEVDRAVFIVRDPYSNIRSILNRLELAGTSDVLTPWQISLLNRTWRCILKGEDIGEYHSNPVEALAQRWSTTMGVLLENRERFFLVKYEEFVQDKGQMIGAIADQFDLELRRDIAPVQGQQFQPRGMTDVDLPRFFGEKNMGIISAICTGRAAQLGYSPP